MKKYSETRKRAFTLFMCLVLIFSLLPTTAFAAEFDAEVDTVESKPESMYSINGKYQIKFRGYINSKFQDFFTLAVPCGYKTVEADYIWAKDPKSPYGSTYGWLLRVNGTVCSTIYGSSYGFPKGIPAIGITTSQYTGNLSFIRDHDMSGVKWTYRVPNTGNGNVIANMTGSAVPLRVQVPIRYIDRATGNTVATDTYIITSYGSSVAYANAAKVPAGYTLDPASQSQTVHFDGSSVTPSQITFYVKQVLEVKATLQIEHVLVDADGEYLESIYEVITLTGLGPHIVHPTPGIVPPQYTIMPYTPGSYTVNVLSGGVASPNQITFIYN